MVEMITIALYTGLAVLSLYVYIYHRRGDN